MAEVGSLLRRPLYVFDLPTELLDTLELKAQLNQLPTQRDAEKSENGSPDRPSTPDTGSASTSCGLCSMSFATVQEQRTHVRSDMHNYNLKQRIRGRQAVGEKEFERLVEELDESISGSDTSSSDESGEEDDSTLTALLRRQARISDPVAEEFSGRKRKRGAGKPPLLWFSSSKLASNQSLGVYRSLFTPQEQVSDSATLLQTLKEKQLAPKPQPKKPIARTSEDGGVPLPEHMQPETTATGPHYFLCMTGGGHFAGMIVSLTPKITKKSGIEDRAATVIAHKTFHRYTTRRKQGGAQSSNDNSKGNAHSAGAALRRYNEMALESDIRNLLDDWRPWIDTSELLFIRATGKTNRRTLFGPYDDQVLRANDERNRGFPFSTRRATQAELMRAFVELTRVKVSTIDEAALARAAEEAEAERRAEETRIANGTKTAPPKPARPSKEQEEAALHTTQLQSLIRRSKAPGLISYLSTNNIPATFEFYPPDAPQNYHAPTPLHLAASSNSAPCVSALLLKAKCDPTVRSKEGKTAFEVAGDRATRDAFRVARSELGEETWDWTAANVPAALTKAEADKRAERDKADLEAEKNAETARRAAETERLRREDREKEEKDRERKFGKGKNVSGGILSAVAQSLTPQQKREEEARGMTPEMRMRLERERRARAAEARMRGN